MSKWRKFKKELIAGLIDADMNKAVQPFGTLWLKIMQAPGNAVSNGLPVNAHEVCHSAPGQIFRKPGDCKVEILGKAASRVGPWNCGCYNTMFRTYNTVGLAFDLDQHGAPIQSTPHFGVRRCSVI